MENKLLELYNLPKQERKEFLMNLSDEELVNLMQDATACLKTLEDLTQAYGELDKLKKKRDIPFIGIWWLIKRESKKAWESGCAAAESEINKKERAIMGSYIWNMLDVEKNAVMAQYHSLKEEDLLTRSSAATFLEIKLKAEFAPIILQESDARQ